MKKLILISAILLNYITAYGQNNTGIGTTAPTVKLQVEGSQYLNAAVTGSAVKDALKINIGQDGFQYGNRTDNFGILMTTNTSISTGSIARINFGDQSTGTAISTRYLSFSVGKTLKELMYITDANTSTNTPGVGINTATPTSTLHVNGSVSMPIITVTGSLDFTADNYYTVIYTGGGAAPTFTLPDPATCKGRMYHLVNASFGGNYHDITLSRPVALYTPAGSTTTVTIITYATVSVSDPTIGNTALIQSDGTQWWRIGL